MRVTIKSKANAVIISFDTHSERFESLSERNRFFRGLYGWEQTVPGNNRVYRYRRHGILDDVPHIKIADSAFIVELANMKQVENYFEKWDNKVECEMIEIMVEMKKLLSRMRNYE